MKSNKKKVQILINWLEIYGTIGDVEIMGKWGESERNNSHCK